MAIMSTRRLHEMLGTPRQIRSVVPKNLRLELGQDQRDLAAVVRTDRSVLRESAAFAEARARWLAAVNTPLLDRGNLDHAANALALRYAAGIAAVGSVLLRERTDELTRRNAFVAHLQAEVSRLKEELQEALILRAASTAWEQPRNPDGTFGGGDGGGGGPEGAEPSVPAGGGKGKGGGADAGGSSAEGGQLVDAGSLLKQWASSAAFGRSVRQSIAAGRPTQDAVGLLEVIAAESRTSFPLFRQVDPAAGGAFGDRTNVDLNLSSFSRTVPANAALVIRLLPGCHAGDCAPFSPYPDEQEFVLGGRFQCLDITPREIVLRQVARFAPGVPYGSGRSAALEEFDIRDARFKPEMDALGSFAMDR